MVMLEMWKEEPVVELTYNQLDAIDRIARFLRVACH
jgi:hypothetical protein